LAGEPFIDPAPGRPSDGATPSPLAVIGAFESTYLPSHDLDVFETSEHDMRWREDLRAMRDAGVTRLRYPIRWHRIEASPGRFDWETTDRVLGWMREEGLRPIVDLVHHTSYPRWLSGGFGDPRFGASYLRFCEAFARRHPWVEEYTLFNEPFATLFLAGHEGVWPPHGRSLTALVALYRQVLPALTAASRMYRELLPGARHVWVDTLEGHAALDAASEEYAALANDRRFFALDVFLGRATDAGRPFLREVVAAGGEDLLGLEPGSIDVLGLDYYAHSEWAYRERAVRDPDVPVGHLQGVAPSPVPAGLAALVPQYGERYDVPLMLSETNLRGTPYDRATWLKHTVEQCELARAAGARLEGYCWFPFVDSLDWNSLLRRCDRCIDPVGVLWLDEHLERRPSSMLAAYRLLAGGARAEDLPAYRLAPATAQFLAGLLDRMQHFDWQEPPADERHLADLALVRARQRSAAA
jgi:beta-glucosidase/6-phospho-beta-glucosidase/beta-galactosidase